MSQISSNVQRASAILLLLGEAGEDGISLRELATRLDDSKAATHRALATLSLDGFVEATTKHGHYRLGPAIYALAQTQNRTSRMVARMRPIMTRIVAELKLPVYLMARAGYDAVCLEMLSTTSTASLTGGAGGRIPLGTGAGSIALLAAQPPEITEMILAANASRYESYPAMRQLTRDFVHDMVNEARKSGYSVETGLFFPNEGGIGIAIEPNREGGAELALAVSVSREFQSADHIKRIIHHLTLALGPLCGLKS